jgi:hypothetical protein
MNIFGRVFGGLLVLISLGWLASIAGLRPGFVGSNQISSENPSGASNLATPAKVNTSPTSATGATPANGSKATVSNFNAGTQKTTAAGQPGSQPEVEKNPRAAGNGTKAIGNAAPAASATPTPAATTAPVAAGW